MEIRGFTLCYAKQKAKQNRNEEKQLQQHLCALQSAVNQNPSQTNTDLKFLRDANQTRPNSTTKNPNTNTLTS